MIDAKLVSELRAKTNAGMVACKKALEEAGGNMEKAIEVLRRMGEMKAAQKTAERNTAEGILVVYVHHNKKMAAMLELQCESDFVAQNADFTAFAEELATQVAAMGPMYVSPETVPAADLEQQKALFMQEVAEDNKPEEIKQKIVAGKLDKWLQDVCLTKQSFFKDEDRTVEQVLNDKIATIGEKIVIARFVRWEVGKTGGVC